MKDDYRKITTQEDLDAVMALPTNEPLRRLAFQGLTIPEHALEFEYKSCLFIACKLPFGLKRKFTDSLVFPNMGELFRFPTALYSAEELYEGYELGHPKSQENTYDARVYRHYLKKGKRAEDIKETLARTLHDHSISSALHTFLEQYDPKDIVGVMGGHGIERTSKQFTQVAQLSKLLTEHGKLMISGGGPGAMEATHLGAWMAGRSDEELQEAIAMLSEAPNFQHPLWLETAMQVRACYPQKQYVSLGIPTWLYGHEPATPFATHIAKYFDNSIREDGILTIAMGGIVYTPGSAGTLQEIFQDAVQNHYLSFGLSSPMAFLDVDYWTKEVPVYPLIQDLLARGKYKNLLLSISDDINEIVDTLLHFN